MTTPLKPFPSPVPRADKLVDPNIVRANDNALRDAVNQLLGEMLAGNLSAAQVGRMANLYDPRLAPNDGDSIIATQSFGRYRG